MTLPDFLKMNAYGAIRLTGHRIDLFHVVEKYQEGYSPEMLHEEYPTLCLELIHRVIRFYLANQAEVDAYVAETIAEAERQSAAGKKIDRAELERRFVERHGEKALAELEQRSRRLDLE